MYYLSCIYRHDGSPTETVDGTTDETDGRQCAAVIRCGERLGRLVKYDHAQADFVDRTHSSPAISQNKARLLTTRSAKHSLTLD